MAIDNVDPAIIGEAIYLTQNHSESLDKASDIGATFEDSLLLYII